MSLYTPQRLFGEGGSSPDALTYEPFLERARLQREQDRDEPARLALGAYVVARLVDKLLLLEDSSELLEGYHWQLEAVRRHSVSFPAILRKRLTSEVWWPRCPTRVSPLRASGRASRRMPTSWSMKDAWRRPWSC